MKTIGLIGGMSWESSVEYYRFINEYTRTKLGGLHSAKSVMASVDFAEVEVLQHEGRWEEAGQLLSGVAQSVERAGAEIVILCTNTMHKVADAVQAGISIPLLHIADPTAERIQTQGFKRVGLLGTRYTMEENFYKGRLSQKFGLEVLVPTAPEREIVHRVIYDELCVGKVEAASHAHYVRVIDNLITAGAQAIILGCTEIELLIKPSECRVPAFDTTRIHAEAAVDWALA
jgi:aspartate racemase